MSEEMKVKQWNLATGLEVRRKSLRDILLLMICINVLITPRPLTLSLKPRIDQNISRWTLTEDARLYGMF